MADKTIGEQIDEALAEPKSATVDGVAVTQHSLSELIAALKFKQAQLAAGSPSRGIRFTKIIPPGAVSR